MPSSDATEPVFDTEEMDQQQQQHLVLVRREGEQVVEPVSIRGSRGGALARRPPR